MRASFSLAVLGLLGVALAAPLAAPIAACSSTPEETEEEDEEDAGTDPAYCRKFCDAQVKAGTLDGTREDCIAKCCKTVAGGCKAGTDPVTDPDGGEPTEAGSDGGPTCAKPCGSVCCGDKEGCGVDTENAPKCVATCVTREDCPEGNACSPATNAKGEPVGPYVCKPNDGKPYRGCHGLFTTCETENFCCVGDANENMFCARKCGIAAECGAATCKGFDFGTVSTSCSGPTACGPM